MLKADKHCYMVGEPRQRAGRPLSIQDPKYYTTVTQAVKSALATAMRMAVEDDHVTTLREFIREQERLQAEFERLLAPLEGGKPRQSMANARAHDKEGNSISQATNPEKTV